MTLIGLTFQSSVSKSRFHDANKTHRGIGTTGKLKHLFQTYNNFIRIIS